MTLPAAALLLCSSGLPHVALAVERAAQHEHVPPALALAVGCVESGLRPDNPMGVLACYPARRGTRTTRDCIRLGVQSLRNRLRASPVERALSVYNRGRDDAKGRRYAGRVLALARRIEQIARER